MKLLILVLLIVFISGCIEPGADYQTGGNSTPLVSNKSSEALSQAKNSSGFQVTGKTNGTSQDARSEANESKMLIDSIAMNLSYFYEKKWNSLYQADELDCSRMSVYFWGYIRTNYHVAPKIVVSYQREHAWLALKVSDVGNSSNYMHWHIRDGDYYYLEATIPKIVTEDNTKFNINGQPFTSAEFYNATVYIFDTPQDANDFQADNSWLGGWNQEFRLKKEDTDKIANFMGFN